MFRKWIQAKIDQAVDKKLEFLNVDYHVEMARKTARTLKQIENIYLGAGGDLYILLEGERNYRKIKAVKRGQL